jgi:subtilase family serine protease
MYSSLVRWRTARRTLLAATATLTLAGGFAAAAAAQTPAGRTSSAGTTVHVRRACAASNNPMVASCLALIRTDVKQESAAVLGFKAPTDDGFGPAQLQSAYNLPSKAAGAGESVAVVDAFDDPPAVSDLAVYRKAWGLPACDKSTGAGCLTKLNQNGGSSPLPAPSGTTGWATEESLDVDMVSAICPLCHIYLLEATGPNLVDLGTAVDTAVKVLHVKFVSNSYGSKQAPRDLGLDAKYYRHRGVAVVASAGDDGYGVMYPAASQYVTSVGGTALRKAAGTTRGWTETVWSGTGAGCSKYEAKPTWQTDKGCSNRTDNDVAAVASPSTGVAVYDSYDQGGWTELGGTSVSSPIIASVFALAGKPAKGTFPSSYPYAHTGDLYNITTGNDGTCTPAYLCHGEVGYNGPTGWGTPDGLGAFTG